MKAKALTEISDNKKAREFFESIGHKVLLWDYECPVGEVNLITKANGMLNFIGFGKEAETLKKAATYYIKRYGIHDVKWQVLAA